MGKLKITYSEREWIEDLLNNQETYKEIAIFLDRDRKTIRNEVKRNSYKGTYIADLAQIYCEQRRIQNRIKYVTENPYIIQFVKSNIKTCSPDVISGRGQLEKNNIKVSHESIYKIVYSLGKEYAKHLVSRRIRRKKRKTSAKDGRGVIKNQISIHDRPQFIADKMRFGHFEGDTIVGKNHKGAIVTVVDKKSRFAFGGLTFDSKSKSINKVVLREIKKCSRKVFSITFDNGKEFAGHEELSQKENLRIYFSDPGCPYQRGQNENFNRILRRHFPKGSDFTILDPKTVQAAFRRINNTPRKSLDYKTPYEVFYDLPIGAILNWN